MGFGSFEEGSPDNGFDSQRNIEKLLSENPASLRKTFLIEAIPP